MIAKYAVYKRKYKYAKLVGVFNIEQLAELVHLSVHDVRCLVNNHHEIIRDYIVLNTDTLTSVESRIEWSRKVKNT